MKKSSPIKLLIVESPAKASTISKYLDDEYTVKASVGHIRDLPKNNKKAINIEAGFVPFYEISKGKENVVSELTSLAKNASVVLLATDPDREGEAIAWHIQQTIGLKNPKRIVFNEITKDAVKEALLHPREIDENLRQAQEARRVLDRLVGYDLSGLIWKKVRYGLSAGRVQSPALRILVEREREIKAFIPETFYTIAAKVKTKKKDELLLECTEEPRDIKRFEEIVEQANNGKWSVLSIKESEAKRAAKAPFTTSTLQQAASTRLGFSPARTMGIAQKLYEQGHITYMRTDSLTLSKQAVGQIAATIESEFGKKYVDLKVFANKSKNAQEAHEAIRPSNSAKKEAGNNEEQRRLYSLIRARTLASQMADARVLKTTITATPGKDVLFTISGLQILDLGWFLADPSARSEEVELPKVEKGEELKLIEVITEERQTPPPPRYSEAGLVRELEKRGIGRPSTYASIIKTIVDRGYVEKIQRSLKPTDTGEVVSGFLEDNFAKYISDSFTAEMENELDEIAEGKRGYVSTLSDFYTPFLKDVNERSKNIEKITNLGDAPKEFPCPLCGSEMIIKLSKNGRFMSCSKFPECSGARNIEGEIIEGPKDTGELCPSCGKANLFERHGRFGKFVACSNYPKCKYIKKDASTLPTTGVKCLACGKGEIVERRGRFGPFYSCINYPDCKFAMKTKPTGNVCSYKRDDGKVCGALMMEGTKTIPERCSDKTCPNHNPHKLEDKTKDMKKKK